MKRIKVAEATPAQVSWLVTMIEIERLRAEGEPIKQWWLEQLAAGEGAHPYATDWLWGGPLFSEAKVAAFYDTEWKHDPADPDDNGDRWYAYSCEGTPNEGNAEGAYSCYGATELLAKARVFVMLSLQDEYADVPEGLL